MIKLIRTKKAETAMARTLNDNANLTNAVVAACEVELNSKAYTYYNAHGCMSLGQAYDLMQLLTHAAPCETIAPLCERKPVSRLAIVKVLRLVFELGYKLGRDSKS